MASSPPPPSNTPPSNPRKRPSMGHAATQPDIKRQKVQPHPLRQASYPDPGAHGFHAVRTPQSARSETGSIANSLVSTSKPSSGKRGRGRPRKSTTLNEDDILASQGDTASNIRGRAPGGARSVVSRRSGDGEADEVDDENDYGDMTMNTQTMDEQDKARIEVERKAEAQRIDRLTSTFTPEQYHAYNLWRASKLNKITLRKIVNQTVSQSVTQAPLQAINIYSKFFVGEIVERARDVQVEWAKKTDEMIKADLEEVTHEIEALEQYIECLDITPVKAEDEDDETKEKEDQRRKFNQVQMPKLRQRLAELKLSESKLKEKANPHKGGLLPDHLREALRRYKADGEGGGVGFDSQSHALMGVQGSGTWRVGQGAGGRRLFR